jgi:hypothetical protein
MKKTIKRINLDGYKITFSYKTKDFSRMKIRNEQGSFLPFVCFVHPSGKIYYKEQIITELKAKDFN